MRRSPRGIDCGLPGLYAIVHLARHGEIATFLGYPTYDQGVFENRWEFRSTVPLLSAFVVVCATECGAGTLV